ncbi:hypothetical protein [uncultured Chryseobacterium sp.]|uniref:hypothetical protein n=1 Tax=uncultured Chryseobacterium sp. TaxID=259322 RepID=UPI0025D1A750|nr:hypothetical protein [uncultured Chryseobacterium sp.]
MRIFFISINFILTLGLINSLSAQSDYKLGISTGAGISIFRNHQPADASHISFNKPISAHLGIKLLRQLGEQDNFFAELMYTRKTIEFRYNLNEADIPFDNKDVIGQKYDCISFYFGYRKVIEKYTHALFFEASLGADYNNNVVVFNRSEGQATEEINQPISFEEFINTNLGEKTYTLSTNAGFGVMFGTRNQYELGAFINIPFHKIQSKASQLSYTWNYNNKDYVHKSSYLGEIYYPSLRITYYVF